MSEQRQIIAMGGGGFSMEPDNLLLDRYVLQQARMPNPTVCFLPTASGDSDGYIGRFYSAFTTLPCRPRHLSLFRQPRDLAGFVAECDVIYVGGGNTRNMLAIWRACELDRMLRAAWESGTVLCGVSAGAICWFEQGHTDSAALSTRWSASVFSPAAAHRTMIASLPGARHSTASLRRKLYQQAMLWMTVPQHTSSTMAWQALSPPALQRKHSTSAWRMGAPWKSCWKPGICCNDRLSNDRWDPQLSWTGSGRDLPHPPNDGRVIGRLNRADLLHSPSQISPAPPPLSTARPAAERLAELDRLKEQSRLTEGEYEEQRRKIISEI
jgi:putative intracellular protease/amidase